MKSKIKILGFLCLLCVSFMCLVIQSPVSSQTAPPVYVNSFTAAYAKYMYCTMGIGDFEEAWSNETGSVSYANKIEVGQLISYYDSVSRGFCFFDTSDIPDNAVLVSGTFSFISNGTDNHLEEFPSLLVLQHSVNESVGVPHVPLAYGDYSYLHYVGNGGALNTTSDLVADGQTFNNITLTEDGLDWINKEGLTKFCLRTDFDIAGDVNNPDTYIVIEGLDQAIDAAPRLTLRYYIPDAQPRYRAILATDGLQAYVGDVVTVALSLNDTDTGLMVEEGHYAVDISRDNLPFLSAFTGVDFSDNSTLARGHTYNITALKVDNVATLNFSSIPLTVSWRDYSVSEGGGGGGAAQAVDALNDLGEAVVSRLPPSWAVWGIIGALILVFLGAALNKKRTSRRGTSTIKKANRL